VRGLAPPQRVHQPVRRVVRAADVVHLASAHEVIEGAEGLLFGHRDVLHVDLIEVDAIGLQPAQGVLAALHDPVPRRAALVRPVTHREAELGGEDHLVTRLALLEPVAEHALGQAVLTVDVGGVDEVDTSVESPIDHPVCGRLVHAGLVHERLLVGLAERHRAQTQRRDADARRSQVPILHRRDQSMTKLGRPGLGAKS
jgi:hypothetical protein